MEKEPVHMWPYLNQFKINLTKFAYLEVFNDVLSGYGIQIQKFQKMFL